MTNVRRLVRDLLMPLLAAALLAPAPAFAACEAAYARFQEATADFGDDYLNNYDPMRPTAMVNADWLSTLDDVGELQEARESWRSAGADDDTPWTALILCLYDSRIAELSGGSASRGTASRASASSDDEGDADADDDAGNAANVTASADSPYLFDDDDHSQCVAIEGIAEGVGNALAYGHYRTINKCSYPIKILTCITPDRADGSPAPNYDLHEDGQPCPGIGWLGGSLAANETEDGREWFRYRNLKWEIRACREGWDFVGRDGVDFPSKVLGEKYRCRKLRPRE